MNKTSLFPLERLISKSLIKRLKNKIFSLLHKKEEKKDQFVAPFNEKDKQAISLLINQNIPWFYSKNINIFTDLNIDKDEFKSLLNNSNNLSNTGWKDLQDISKILQKAKETYLKKEANIKGTKKILQKNIKNNSIIRNRIHDNWILI